MLALARMTSSAHLRTPTWLRYALLRQALTLDMWLCGCTALMPSASGHAKTGWDRGQGKAEGPGIQIVSTNTLPIETAISFRYSRRATSSHSEMNGYT
jgi:hypothetical protein